MKAPTTKTQCPKCKAFLLRVMTCADCLHSFLNPFDQLLCLEGKTATRVCCLFKKKAKA